VNGSSTFESPSPETESRPLTTRTRIAREWLFPLATVLISIVLLTGVVGGLVLVLGLPLTGSEVIVAVCLAFAGLTLWARRQSDWRIVKWVVIVGLAMAIILPNLLMMGRVLEDTWDGQWIHQEAVIQLAEGWNPFRTDLTEREVPDEGGRIRLNGYPKASWIWGASLYRLTGRIERAKAFSLPLMVASGLVVLTCLLLMTQLPPALAVLIAGVVAANPVVLTQVLNTYQDGPLASLFTIVAASLALWVGSGSRSGLGLATGAAVGVASIKLTGPVYVAIVVAAAVLWSVFRGRWRRQWREFLVALVLAAIGVALLSGGAYVTNAFRHGHPLYPVLGPDSITIVDAPPHSRFQALAASIFLPSQLTFDDRETVEILQNWKGLKPPFTFDRDELSVFFDPNVRIGGWGPLFGGVVILSLLLLGVTTVRRPRCAVWLVIAVAPIVLSVLVNPICWKARYAPQSWIVPPILAAMTLAFRYGTRSPSETEVNASGESTVGRNRPCAPRRVETVLASAVLLTAACNSMLVAWIHVPGVIAHSAPLKARLLELGQRRHELELNLDPFRSNRVRLAELGIEFTEVDDYRNNLPVYLGYSPLRIKHFDIEKSEGGGGVVRFAWTATPGVNHYLVEAVVQGAVGPGGSVLSVIRRHTAETHAEIPIPAAPVKILVSNCNALGCGPAAVEGPVSSGGGERRGPILGSPDRGEIVRESSVLFSWLPAVDHEGDPERYRLEIVDLASGVRVFEHETSELWAEHRFADDGVWQARLSLAGSDVGTAEAVEFRTEGVAAPRLIVPVSETTCSSGAVELRWTDVEGASSYEYFIAVTGEPDPVVRDLTSSCTATINLTVVDHGATTYSIIVRACLDSEGCTLGSDRGWGPWSHEAGFGDVKLTVVP